MKRRMEGCLFSVPLPDGASLIGRVLLDLARCRRSRKLPPDSPLPGLGKAVLVEMYKPHPSAEPQDSPEILVNGAFVESNLLGTSWPIVGKREVLPASIEFPETLIVFMHAAGEAAFQCGEISIPIPLGYREARALGATSTRHSSFLWPFTCLRMLGRGAEVPEGYKMASLEGTDLRLSPNRSFVYRHLPFAMSDSYLEKQRMFSLDFERLFE